MNWFSCVMNTGSSCRGPFGSWLDELPRRLFLRRAPAGCFLPTLTRPCSCHLLSQCQSCRVPCWGCCDFSCPVDFESGGCQRSSALRVVGRECCLSSRRLAQRYSRRWLPHRPRHRHSARPTSYSVHSGWRYSDSSDGSSG